MARLEGGVDGVLIVLQPSDFSLQPAFSNKEWQ